MNRTALWVLLGCVLAGASVTLREPPMAQAARFASRPDHNGDRTNGIGRHRQHRTSTHPAAHALGVSFNAAAGTIDVQPRGNVPCVSYRQPGKPVVDVFLHPKSRQPFLVRGVRDATNGHAARTVIMPQPQDRGGGFLIQHGKSHTIARQGSLPRQLRRVFTQSGARRTVAVDRLADHFGWQRNTRPPPATQYRPASVASPEAMRIALGKAIQEQEAFATLHLGRQYAQVQIVAEYLQGDRRGQSLVAVPGSSGSGILLLCQWQPDASGAGISVTKIERTSAQSENSSHPPTLSPDQLSTIYRLLEAP